MMDDLGFVMKHSACKVAQIRMRLRQLLMAWGKTSLQTSRLGLSRSSVHSHAEDDPTELPGLSDR